MSPLKLVLISTGVLSAAIMVGSSASGAISDFAERVPPIYNRVVSWLSPSFLHLLINFIIMAIFASTKLHCRKEEDDVSVSTTNIVQPHSSWTAKSIQSAVDRNVEEPPVVAASGGGDGGASAADAMWNKEIEYAIAISKLEWGFFSDNTKPAFSTRFSHRRNAKASPEEVRTMMGVSRSKKHDTVESTWRTISQGRAISITRHVEKPETYDRPRKSMEKAKTFSDRRNPSPVSSDSGGPDVKKPNTCDRPRISMKKSKTFSDRRRPSPVSTDSGGPEKLRRDASLGREELNMKVEAFIKKFKEELRMQGQE